MRLLDLDNRDSWLEPYSNCIKKDVLWPDIKRIIRNHDKTEFCQLLTQLTYAAEHVDRIEISGLRSRCRTFFEGQYTHVAAYHACRPWDQSTYRTLGIRPSNPDEIFKFAYKICPDSDAVTQAINQIKGSGGYLKHNQGKVGLSLSLQGVRANNHLLKHGSELLHAIVAQADKVTEQELSRRGIPTAFRCAIPINWLDQYTTFPVKEGYAVHPLAQVLVEMRWPERKDGEWEGSFMLTREVPPDLILNTIDMTATIAKLLNGEDL